MEELIKMLNEAAMIDYDFPRAKLMKRAAEALERNIPRENEIEGGGSSWWYVCPECHGAIDRQDHFCKHCGQAVKE
jgi:rRNA maturation endonuclease Nob1